MKNGIVLVLLVCILCTSCSENTILLKSNTVEDLTTASKVYYKGLEVGEVEDITIAEDGSVITNISLKGELEIPRDSDFKLTEIGLIDPLSIAIELGESEVLVSESDTLSLVLDETPRAVEASLSEIGGVLNSIFGNTKEDSILFELRRMNENLESLSE